MTDDFCWLITPANTGIYPAEVSLQARIKNSSSARMNVMRPQVCLFLICRKVPPFSQPMKKEKRCRQSWTNGTSMERTISSQPNQLTNQKQQQAKILRRSICLTARQKNWSRKLSLKQNCQQQPKWHTISTLCPSQI